METSDFIDLVISGNAVEAKEALENILGNVAIDALANKKQELASRAFGEKEETTEIESEAE